MLIADDDGAALARCSSPIQRNPRAEREVISKADNEGHSLDKTRPSDVIGALKAHYGVLSAKSAALRHARMHAVRPSFLVSLR